MSCMSVVHRERRCMQCQHHSIEIRYNTRSRIPTWRTPDPSPFPIHHNLLDIYKNRPRVIEHEERPNDEMWIGTEMQVLVAGNWTTYKSRVVQYLQQLAIITPYARLEMSYTNRSDERKGMNLRFERRSEQMPAQAREVKHHPSSVSFTYLRPSCRCCFLSSV